MSEFAAKQLAALPCKVTLPADVQVMQALITLESPAELLFTDLRKVPAVSVAASAQIDRALEQMVAAGVRLLFVVSGEREPVGLVTSFDIAGEKPLQILGARGHHPSRGDIQVQDVMQPVEHWAVLERAQVERSRVGDIVETFKKFGLRHLIVVDAVSGSDATEIAGLFSATQFERTLGVQLDITRTPRSFAELEHALMHPE